MTQEAEKELSLLAPSHKEVPGQPGYKETNNKMKSKPLGMVAHSSTEEAEAGGLHDFEDRVVHCL